MSFLPMLIPLTFMMLSDWKTRTVSLVWLALLFLATSAGAILAYGIRAALTFMAVNMAILLVLGLSLYAYSLLRKKRLGELGGIGDALFFAAITPMSAPEEYVRRILAMLAISLILWMALRKRFSLATIPLVSFCGIPLVSIIIFFAIRQWTI